MKNFLLIILLSIAIGGRLAAQCDNVNCSGTTASGVNASAIGTNTTASGHSSFASGNLAIAQGNFSTAIGGNVTASADNSITVGRFLQTGGGQSIVIGSGKNNTTRLINGFSNTLMIGFSSDKPTFFVSETPENRQTGRIGIGNITDPQVKLHILSDVDEAAELKLEHRTTGANQIARIYLGSHKIEASSNSHMNFYTTNSSQHYNFHNGTIRSEQGTAAVPAYSFRLSPTTGMFRPSTNTIAFSTGGQERVRIISSGNVGISTINPIEKLQVEGFARTSSGYKVGTDTVINSNRDYTGRNGSFTGVLSVTGNGNSSFNGNVGIGTNSPDKKLVVAGDISFTGDLYKNGVLFNSSNWTVSGSNIYRSSGNVGIGTTSPDKKLVVAGDIKFTGDLYKNGELFNSSNWTVSGSNIYRSSGNVGIGTSSPNEKLEIAGWVRTSDGYKVGANTVIDINRNFNGNNSTFSGILNVTGNSLFSGDVGIGTNSPDAKFHVKVNESNTYTARIQTGTKSVYFGRAIYGPEIEWGNSYIGLGLYRDGDNLWKTEVDYEANGGAMIWGTISGNLAFTCIPSTQSGVSLELNDAEIKANTRMYLTSSGVLKVNEVLVKTDIWSD